MCFPDVGAFLCLFKHQNVLGLNRNRHVARARRQDVSADPGTHRAFRARNSKIKQFHDTEEPAGDDAGRYRSTAVTHGKTGQTDGHLDFSALGNGARIGQTKRRFDPSTAHAAGEFVDLGEEVLRLVLGGGDPLAQQIVADLALGPGQLRGLTTDQMAGLPSDIAAKLTATQLGGLTTRQVASLTTDQVAALTTEQAAGLKTSQIAALTTEQVQALETTDLESLTTTQVAALDPTRLAGMTSTQLKGLTSSQVAALTERLDGLRSVVAITAQRDVNALPENLRAYVLAQAGDDPVRQINAIEGLRAHGLVPAALQVVPQGATTLPAGNAAPPPSTQTANPDLAALTRYEELKAKSPHSAALFYATNSAAIGRGRLARPS